MKITTDTSGWKRATIITPVKQQPTRAEVNAEQSDRPSTSAREILKWLRHSLQFQLLFLLCVLGMVLIENFRAYETQLLTVVSRLLDYGSNTQSPAVRPQKASAEPSYAVLDVFQVTQPVLTPAEPTDLINSNDQSSNTSTVVFAEAVPSCNQLLMEHSFGFSYGHPFVGRYNPPSCEFNRVVMNFTVTSKGRQFDRLALMYFGDTEVWRTSTAEPITDGIRWTYIKDMSEYLYFWNQTQKLIFDLGNLIDSTYTGFFNTTLTATFFTSSDTLDPAGLIIPISARNSASNTTSLFILPADTATNTIGFPRNANRAVFSVSACGQAAEEFWWSNVLQSDTDTFIPNDGILPGFSPWREVQIYIDGQLAGVQWPFPVIFTGGVAPGLWRPIVGIDTFDLREREIDITPWLPLLCDGNRHTFEMKVAGIDDDGGTTGAVTETVGNSWYVTGKIFVWLDAPLSTTTGTAPAIIQPLPHITLSQSYTQDITTGINQSLTYSTIVTRSFSVSSIVKSQAGTSAATWTQSLSFSYNGSFTNKGITLVSDFLSTGLDISAGAYPYKSSYSYPLYANTTFTVDSSNNFSISATLIHGLFLEVTGNSIYPSGLESFTSRPNANSVPSSFSGSQLRTIQNGTAYYFSSPSTKTGVSFGSTKQFFNFCGVATGHPTELYSRDVMAVNETIVVDNERFMGVEIGNYENPAPPRKDVEHQGSLGSPKAVIGRGPGQSNPALVHGSGEV